GLLVGIWGINAAFGSTNSDFETRMIGAMIDFMPLIVCGISFVLLYMFGNLIRSYYLYKYSEEFRLMFGVEKDSWYGRLISGS
ncbi:hypothetical protein J4G37_47245, partial [Microvirga sp. 3-52]|nr:hypothetical protein [Microvirga sp. 3-52]